MVFDRENIRNSFSVESGGILVLLAIDKALQDDMPVFDDNYVGCDAVGI
jgi:hypothetical protein